MSWLIFFSLQQPLSSSISRSDECATVFRRTHSVCSGQDKVKNPPQELPPCEESWATFQVGPGALRGPPMPPMTESSHRLLPGIIDKKRFYWTFQSTLTGCKGLVSQTPSLTLIMSFDGKQSKETKPSDVA